MSNVVITLEKAQHYIEQLNFTYIIDTLCALDYPLPRWTLSDATQCAQLYKNFLFLNKKYPASTLVPTHEMDEFWHQHILHTKKYFHDCENIFGYYLHHEPAAAMDDTTQLLQDYSKTKALYEVEFKQALHLLKTND